MKRVPGGVNIVNGVQCYELFGGIALRNNAFLSLFYSDSHFIIINLKIKKKILPDSSQDHDPRAFLMMCFLIPTLILA